MEGAKTANLDRVGLSWFDPAHTSRGSSSLYEQSHSCPLAVPNSELRDVIRHISLAVFADTSSPVLSMAVGYYRRVGVA